MTEPRPDVARDPAAADAAEDRSLIEAARSGPVPARRAAFARLYERHKDAVWSFLLALAGERGLAEDALQETFLRAWRGLDGFQTGRAARPWLLTIARHAATDLLRTRGKEQRNATRAATGSAPPDALEAAAAAEARARARQALAELPSESRALLLQRHGQGAPLLELAETWDVTERTVRNRLRAAAEQLALILSRPEGGRA